MQRRITMSGLLMAAVVTLAGPVQAQTQQELEQRLRERKCNLRDQVLEMKRDLSTFGPGITIQSVYSNLKSFKKNVLLLAGRNDIIIPNSLGADILKKKLETFADVDSDNSEFEELLRDVVAAKLDHAAKDDLCARCRLLSTWKVFKMGDFPYVTSDILETMKRQSSFPLMKKDVERLKEERERVPNDPEMIAPLATRINSYLSNVPFRDQQIDWLNRYGDNRVPLIRATKPVMSGGRQITYTGKTYGDSMNKLVDGAQCGEE